MYLTKLLNKAVGLIRVERTILFENSDGTSLAQTISEIQVQQRRNIKSIMDYYNTNINVEDMRVLRGPQCGLPQPCWWQSLKKQRLPYSLDKPKKSTKLADQSIFEDNFWGIHHVVSNCLVLN